MKKKDAPRGFVFYTQDYFGAMDVRLMPVEIRCVWVEMFFLMDQSPRRGVLLKKNGDLYSREDLARVINCSAETIDQATTYVLNEKIASSDRWTGALTNRRMMKEEKRRQIGSKFGRKGGGNPALQDKAVINQDEINPRQTGAKLALIDNLAASVTPTNSKPINATFKGVTKGDLYTTDPEPDPEPDRGRGITVEGSIHIDSPPTEKRGGHHDAAADHFNRRCLELTGAPYEFQRADFVRLASLRKAYKIESTATPPDWPESVTNYFASPLSKYSIADLCARYSVFRNSALDEFSKPINHANRRNGNGRQTKTDRNREAAESLLSRLDQQDREREQRGNHRGDTGDVPGTAVTAKSGADK